MVSTDTALTIAERIERTLALDAEMRALWPDESVQVTVHNLSHEQVHEGALLAALAVEHPTPGQWIVSAHLGEKWRSPVVYAAADPDCSTCRALVNEGQTREAWRAAEEAARDR